MVRKIGLLSLLVIAIVSNSIYSQDSPTSTTYTTDYFMLTKVTEDIANKNFNSFSFSLLGQASWYSECDKGILKTTANMEQFNDRKLTCAMWGIPFNTLVRVTNRENGKSVIVRVNDRGPAKRLARRGRVIDLTKRAFSRIASLKYGLISVQVTILPNKNR